MQIMHVQMLHLRRQLACHGEGLPETAHAVGGEVALQIAPERLDRASETLLPQAPERAPQHPHRLLVEVFRQIGDAGLDGLVHGMHGPLGRMAQGPDFQVQAALLEGQDFLGDEGFGKARIAFHDDGDAPVCH